MVLGLTTAASGGAGSTGGAGSGVGAAVARGAGVRVVTVSGDIDGPGGGGAGVDMASWAGVVVGWLVGVGAAGEVRVAETDPLSPPPRMITVQMTATSRITPATEATQTHRRSTGS